MPTTTENVTPIDKQTQTTEQPKFKGSNINDYDDANTETVNGQSQAKEDPKTVLQADMANAESLLRRTFRAAGIYNKEDMRYNDTFYRFRRIDPFYMVEGATEYLFFVKPDLNILTSGGELVSSSSSGTGIGGGGSSMYESGVASVPYFQELVKAGYKNTVLSDLCYSNSTVDKCPFVRMLSNRKTSNMDIPDIIVDELETAQNMYGTRIFYPKSSLKADEDAEFSIEFEDTQYLEIYNFFKTYDIFRQLKWLGVVSPTITDISNKILYDHMSIYKFLVDTDGETILYYAKATGVYPKSISRSAFSEIQDKGSLKITVSFKLSGWFEDLEPNILVDFNNLISHWIGSNATESPIWDDEISAVSGENLKYFYISRAPGYMSDKPGVDSKGYMRYLLKGGR